jgi:hypothetical protein
MMMTTTTKQRRLRTGGLVLAAAAALSGISASALASDRSGVLPPDIGNTDEWIVDLGTLDEVVRTKYPEPFTNTSETEWASALAELASTLPSASATEAASQVNRALAELVGGSIVELPNSAIVVYLPDTITEAVHADLRPPVPCPAPRPAACPQ